MDETKYLERVISLYSIDISKCHKCGEPNSYYRLNGRRGFGCTKCGQQYFPCVKTIFEGSKVDLKCWFDIADLLIKNDLSGREISRRVGICVPSACTIKKKIISSGLFGIPDRSKIKICKVCKIEKEKNSENFRIRLFKGKRYMIKTCRVCELELIYKYRRENIDKIRELSRKSSKKRRLTNKEASNEYQKLQRSKPGYLEKRKRYIEKNKDKIYLQEKVAKRRYAHKHRDLLTDQYCITRLIQKTNLSKSDIQARPDLIDFYRAKIMLEREIRKLLPNKETHLNA